MFDFFYSFARWANDYYNGHYTEKEISTNAEAYTQEARSCKAGHMTDTIKNLLAMLKDDISENAEALYYYNGIIEYIKGR